MGRRRRIAPAPCGGREPELRQLRMFVTVAEELHFTRAAERLYMAQPALSAQIRQLEALLGARLFDRTTRSVRLTEAGRTLLSHAIPLLSAASRTWQAVADTTSGDAGNVGFSYAPTVGRVMLPRILQEFNARHPNIYLRPCQIWHDDDRLDDDLEVAIARVPHTGDPDVTSMTLFETPLGLVLGHDHPLAAGAEVCLADLRHEALKLWPRSFSPQFHDVIVSLLRAGGFTGPVEEMTIFGSRFLFDDPQACRHIREHRAFGIGFPGQYDDLEPDIVWRPVTPAILVPMYLSWRHDASPAARNLVSVILDVAASMELLPEDRRRGAAELLHA